jgi:hypothetical protein
MFTHTMTEYERAQHAFKEHMPNLGTHAGSVNDLMLEMFIDDNPEWFNMSDDELNGAIQSYITSHEPTVKDGWFTYKR